MDKFTFKTADGIDVNLEKLSRAFPEVITETVGEDGKIRRVADFEKLKMLLGDSAAERPQEFYEFTWPGKNEAIFETAKATTKTLRPCPEESKNWDASLLTTGWDEPSVDCVYILRPTKSQVLFSQMVGRGTRVCEGKDHLLLLDPLFLSDDLNLIRPARLVAKDPEEAVFLQSRLDTEGGDLMVEADRAKSDRAKSIQERLIETRTKSSRTIDAMELALSLDRFDIVDYEPEFRWERQPISDGQKSVLAGGGFDTDIPEMCKGLASKIIDLLYQRREMGLATPRQVRLLRRLGFKNAATVSFDEAKRMISARLDGKARHDGN